MRALGDGVVELADGSSERADQVLVATGAWTSALCSAAPIRSTQQVNVYLRLPTAGLPVWTYDLDVYGLGDDGGAGLKVGGHAIGADVDPDDPAAREAPRGGGASGLPTRRAGACRGCPGPTARRACAAPTSAATR